MRDIELASLADAEVLYLTTTGRVSGQARTIEIWFTYYEGRLYLNAEHGHDAQWVRNILFQPSVHIRLQQHDFDGYARVLDRQQDQALWHIVADLSRDKYGWGEGLPVEINLGRVERRRGGVRHGE